VERGTGKRQEGKKEERTEVEKEDYHRKQGRYIEEKIKVNIRRKWVYSSPNIVRVIKSRRMRWAGHVARMGEERGMYRVLVGKSEGRRQLGRPRHRWVDNIRMDLQEVGCRYMDWIVLTQDRDRWRTLVSAVMNLRVP